MPEVQVKPYFGGFVLETLTVGMYGESRNALREYVQNAFDSIQRARQKGVARPEEGTIQITMSDGQLTIRDNGDGLPTANAVQTLTNIGASSKNYKREAGFRGIGRLSGIVFSNKVIFSTKAAGEDLQTIVTFDAAGMREAMKPDSASELSAEQMITNFVKAEQTPADDLEEHFFEVKLIGFEDAPEECTSAIKLDAFLSQVAPVPYAEDIPDQLKVLLQQGQAKHKIPIETVKVEIIEGDTVTQVVRPYRTQYAVGRESRDGDVEEMGQVSIKTFEPIEGTDWWGWWGDKEETGQYASSQVSGIRVRVKNIQIDGTEVFRDIFKSQAKTYIRFQDWFIGEIFVKPEALVPNARRDGFEENSSWKVVRREWGAVAKNLGIRAYEVSDKSQTTLDKLHQERSSVESAFEALKRSDFENAERTIEFAATITKLQKQVARATKNASPRVLPDLQAMSYELADMRSMAVSKLRPVIQQVDEEAQREAHRREMIDELLSAFEDQLEQPCLGRVRSIIRKYYS